MRVGEVGVQRGAVMQVLVWAVPCHAMPAMRCHAVQCPPCHTMPCTAVPCSVVRCLPCHAVPGGARGAMPCSAHPVMPWHAVLCHAAWCDAHPATPCHEAPMVLCHAAQFPPCHAVPCSAVPCGTVQCPPCCAVPCSAHGAMPCSAVPTLPPGFLFPIRPWGAAIGTKGEALLNGVSAAPQGHSCTQVLGYAAGPSTQWHSWHPAAPQQVRQAPLRTPPPCLTGHFVPSITAVLLRAPVGWQRLLWVPRVEAGMGAAPAWGPGEVLGGPRAQDSSQPWGTYWLGGGNAGAGTAWSWVTVGAMGHSGVRGGSVECQGAQWGAVGLKWGAGSLVGCRGLGRLCSSREGRGGTDLQGGEPPKMGKPCVSPQHSLQASRLGCAPGLVNSPKPEMGPPGW